MKTIAWDVDDVLNDLMGSWLADKWLPEYPSCRVGFKQITQNTPERIIHSTKEIYQRSLDDFRLSGAYLKLKPDARILAWFEKFGGKARHIALTAVPINAAHVSAFWVMKNFARWIRCFNFVPSPRPAAQDPGYHRSKADYLKWLGKVDILVEDSTENIAAAQKLGIKGILIKKPWNTGGLSVKEALTGINKITKEK